MNAQANQMVKDPNDWSDLDDLDSAPIRKTSNVETVTQKCINCGGSGRRTYGYVNIRTYECKMCKGTGNVTAQRIKRFEAAKKAMRTAEINKANRGVEYRKEHPPIQSWIVANAGRFDFATAMDEAIRDHGGLTDNQEAAVLRCIARDADRREQRSKDNVARSVTIDASKVVTALNAAFGHGVKNPKLRFINLTFSLAKAHSKNPGCTYVKTGETYLGKIDAAGVYTPTRECTDEMKAQVVEVAADPIAASLRHGKLTGNCACCGRKLTAAESVKRTIGPTCASKYGFMFPADDEFPEAVTEVAK